LNENIEIRYLKDEEEKENSNQIPFVERRRKNIRICIFIQELFFLLISGITLIFEVVAIYLFIKAHIYMKKN
jgi:hypothetical protein